MIHSDEVPSPKFLEILQGFFSNLEVEVELQQGTR